MPDFPHVPVITKAPTTAGPQQGLTPELIADLIPEKGFKGGATILLQREGDLGVVALGRFPEGTMLCVIPAEQARFVRDDITRAAEAHRKHMEKMARNGVGLGG
jgi:hypothetical protein